MLEIAERKAAGVVSKERKDVLMIDKLPFRMSNEEFIAKRQQCVRFIPPSCGWWRDEEDGVRFVS